LSIFFPGKRWEDETVIVNIGFKTTKCFVNDVEVSCENDGSGFASVLRTCDKDSVRIVLTHRLSCWPLVDQPNTVAFMDGPIVLAGLVGEERSLTGNIENPYSMLTPDNEKMWQTWKRGWRTIFSIDVFTSLAAE
jgi:hypothetical protein